jgi:F420-dependent oxidoreductase-like protein
MRVALTLPPSIEHWEETGRYVTEAERLGVDSVWSAETWGHDAPTPLAFLAARTRRIGLGTAVMQAGTRSPALVAMTAMSLAAMSGDRFTLGLGVSGPQVIEGWHGVRFDRPAKRLRETVEIIRCAVQGKRLTYKGDVYEVPLAGGEGRALQSAARPRPAIPIYLAALAPRSLELTGEIADGWLGMAFMPECAHVFLDHLATGAQRAGRPLADLDLQAGGVAAVSDDVDRLMPSLKRRLAFTLGGMGSRQHNFYNDAFRRAGYEDVAAEVQRLWLAGHWREAAGRVPSELVLQTNLVGTAPMVRRRLEAYASAGITTIRVEAAGDTLDERLGTLEHLLDLVDNAEIDRPGGVRVEARDAPYRASSADPGSRLGRALG